MDRSTLTHDQILKLIKHYVDSNSMNNPKDIYTNHIGKAVNLVVYSPLRKASEDPTEVGMYDGRHSTTTLQTGGVNGCMVLAYKSSERSAAGIMTHFPPTHTKENIARVQELVEEHPELRLGRKRGVVIHAQGLELQAQQLAEKTRDIVGGAEITLVPYVMCEDTQVICSSAGGNGVATLDIITGKYDFNPVHQEGYIIPHHGYL